ncbi:MAG TPA: hypothetical protein VLC09_10175 [Polyangiaceae bacterium]|nr:hypothetical protein [Polyangiaceae bacterium]
MICRPFQLSTGAALLLVTACGSPSREEAAPIFQDAFESLGKVLDAGGLLGLCFEMRAFAPDGDRAFQTDGYVTYKSCRTDEGREYSARADFRLETTATEGQYVGTVTADYGGCLLQVSVTYAAIDSSTGYLAAVDCASLCGQAILSAELERLGIPWAELLVPRYGTVTSGGRQVPVQIDTESCFPLTDE